MPDFEALLDLFAQNPYVGVFCVFVLCGLGLPMPEEIVLIAAGYMTHIGVAKWPQMMGACTLGIAAGDVVPFMLGRMFGPKLLRWRFMRLLINRQRLFLFDRWFRKRGDLVIVVARFVPGLRVVAFFTAATMRMTLARFVFLDAIGIAVVVPLFTFIGRHFGPTIEKALHWVKQVERTILVFALAGAGLLLTIYWLRARRKAKALVEGPEETYVGPSPESAPVEEPPPPEQTKTS